jgi:ATP/maltotriose-dependent transcriptional regulator MalT
MSTRPLTSRLALLPTHSRPARPGETIARPRLDAHAAKLGAFALTTVSAGAGFGKTIVLRRWADAARAEFDVAWVAFQPGDGDVATVSAYLEAALKAASPGFGAVVDPLRAAGVIEPEAFAASLANAILITTEDNARDVAIFIDDFHAVGDNEGVRQLIGTMLRMLPPRAHVVISGRVPLDFSPIVKLRADGRVAEFTQDDLRFTSDEAFALFESAGLGNRERDALEALMRRADGWAMALRLCAQAAAVETTTDLHLRSERSERALFAYLADEVLRGQPAEIRDILFVCAVPNAVDEATVGYLLGNNDGRPAIGSLLARNLHLEVAGDRTYRFHDLFRAFLLETMSREQPDRLRALRTRYAQLLETSGRSVEAVAQYLEAGNFLAAADHVSQMQLAIKYGHETERIAALLAGIPDEIKRKRPRLLQFEGSARRRQYDFAGADATFARAREYALAAGDYPTACSCALERGMLADELRAGGHGVFAASLAHFTEAYADAERCGAKRDTYLKMSSLALGLVHAARFEYDLAKPHLARAEALQLAAPTRRNDILTTIATIHGWKGDWQKSLETAELSEDLLRTSGAESLMGRALKVQARAHCFLREDLERALTLAERAAELERLHNEEDDLPDAYVVLARAHLAQTVPQIEKAHAALDEAARRLGRRPNRVAQFEVHAARVETLILTGRRLEVRRELAAARTLADVNGDPHQRALVTFLEGLTAAASGEHAPAAAAFVAAFERFAPLADKFYTQLSDLAARAAEVRLGTLTAQTLEATLARLGAEGRPTALRSAPRSAALVLSWALRHGVAEHQAEALLAEAAARAGDEELIALAQDATASSTARARAIALLTKSPRLEARAILLKLAREKDPAVAAAASTALAIFPEPVPAQLEIFLVGQLRVHIGTEIVTERDARWLRRKAIEMLRALALADGPVPKTTLIADLWPEGAPAAAETSLRVTLHALRRALEPESEGPGRYVEYDGVTLALRRGVVAGTDVREAQAAFRRAAFARASKDTGNAEKLYERTISLLESVPEEDAVHAWLAPHVRRWRHTLAAALRATAELRLEAGSPAVALLFIERSLRVDPLDEESVRIALDAALAAGDTERARRTFVDYKRRLASELSATPGHELIARYGDVLKARAENRGTELSSRELRILALIGKGRSTKQIAAELGLSAWSINGSVGRILRKMRVGSRAAAVAAAGWLLDS